MFVCRVSTTHRPPYLWSGSRWWWDIASAGVPRENTKLACHSFIFFLATKLLRHYIVLVGRVSVIANTGGAKQTWR